MFCDFIEIGTSDFDTLVEGASDDMVGISIDPVPIYLDHLPCPRQWTKLNIAVSDFDGETSVFYIRPEDIAKYALPAWLKGCNTLDAPHPTAMACLAERGLDPELIISERVAVRRLISIVHEKSLTGIYLLKIDAEGHDEVILSKYFENCNRFQYPHELIFETNKLGNSDNIHSLIIKLVNIGYDIISCSIGEEASNTHLRLNILRVGQRDIFSQPISGYFLAGYPQGYNCERPPHANTLDAAMDYCWRLKQGGVTYQYGRYEVREGRHLIAQRDNRDIISWTLIGLK